MLYCLLFASSSGRSNAISATLLTQFLRRIEEEMLKIHVSSLATQFRPQRLPYKTFISRLLCSQLRIKAAAVPTKTDTLAVRIVHRAFIISPTRGSQQRFCQHTNVNQNGQLCESVCFHWNSLYLKLRAKQSRNKCFVGKALWTELRSE